MNSTEEAEYSTNPVIIDMTITEMLLTSSNGSGWHLVCKTFSATAWCVRAPIYSQQRNRTWSTDSKNSLGLQKTIWNWLVFITYPNPKGSFNQSTLVYMYFGKQANHPDTQLFQFILLGTDWLVSLVVPHKHSLKSSITTDIKSGLFLHILLTLSTQKAMWLDL